MALRAGQFYTCAAYPRELLDTSPLKSNELGVPNSPKIGELLRVSEDTNVWHIRNVKVAKPHFCYLARFDDSSNIGIIFLGSSSEQTPPHRFVTVFSGENAPSNVLCTVPSRAFPSSFLLNLTHPLRVKLVYLRAELSVGVTSVRLNPHSENTFWELHKAYHKIGRGQNFITEDETVEDEGPDNQDGGDESGGPSNNGPNNRVEDIEFTGGSQDSTGMIEEDVKEAAPWGRIGGFKIGIDIPLIAEEIDSESEDELDEIFNTSNVDGIVYLQDL